MAEAAYITSRRSMLGLLAATAVAGVPVAASSAVDRSAWEEAVRDHAAADAAAALASRQEDEARGAFFAECPDEPALRLDVPTTDHDGKPLIFPVSFVSEDELRGKCWLDDTRLGPAHDEARRVLIPRLDAWKAKRDELYRKYRIEELSRTANAAMEKAYVAEARLMNTPAPDLAAVLHKLTMVWGEDGDLDRANDEDKLAILADVRRLAHLAN